MDSQKHRGQDFFLDLISLLEEILGSILEATGATIMNCWEMRGGVACIGSDSCLIAVLIIITSSWSDFMSKWVEKDIALESQGVDYDDDCDDDVHLMEKEMMEKNRFLLPQQESFSLSVRWWWRRCKRTSCVLINFDDSFLLFLSCLFFSFYIWSVFRFVFFRLQSIFSFRLHDYYVFDSLRIVIHQI